MIHGDLKLYGDPICARCLNQLTVRKNQGVYALYCVECKEVKIF